MSDNDPERDRHPAEPQPRSDLTMPANDTSARTGRRVSKRSAVAALTGGAVIAALTWGVVSSSGGASSAWSKPADGPDPSFGGPQGTSQVPAERPQRRRVDAYQDASYPRTLATTAQQKGVVDIYTLMSDGSEAAGTGIVVTHRGEIVTNNHVIEGSTKIRVVVVSTHATYSARVVGTDATDDVAVLQLTRAKRLTTAEIASNTRVRVGDPVTGVGNAGGVGGTPSAASGRVRAVDRAITVRSETDNTTEHLTGLIKVAADIQSGDSGGPLYNSDDEVVGLDTAASSGRTPVLGFAIPVSTAMTIADKIESGAATSKIIIGYPGFLGVELRAGSGNHGAKVQGVVPRSTAAGAGLSPGDTITAIDGTPVSSARSLSTLLESYSSGDSVAVTWASPGHGTYTKTVMLGRGPAA